MPAPCTPPPLPKPCALRFHVCVWAFAQSADTAIRAAVLEIFVVR